MADRAKINNITQKKSKFNIVKIGILGLDLKKYYTVKPLYFNHILSQTICVKQKPRAVEIM